MKYHTALRISSVLGALALVGLLSRESEPYMLENIRIKTKSNPAFSVEGTVVVIPDLKIISERCDGLYDRMEISYPGFSRSSQFRRRQYREDLLYFEMIGPTTFENCGMPSRKKPGKDELVV